MMSLDGWRSRRGRERRGGREGRERRGGRGGEGEEGRERRGGRGGEGEEGREGDRIRWMEMGERGTVERTE